MMLASVFQTDVTTLTLNERVAIRKRTSAKRAEELQDIEEDAMWTFVDVGGEQW